MVGEYVANIYKAVEDIVLLSMAEIVCHQRTIDTLQQFYNGSSECYCV